MASVTFDQKMSSVQRKNELVVEFGHSIQAVMTGLAISAIKVAMPGDEDRFSRLVAIDADNFFAYEGVSRMAASASEGLPIEVQLMVLKAEFSQQVVLK